MQSSVLIKEFQFHLYKRFEDSSALLKESSDEEVNEKVKQNLDKKTAKWKQELEASNKNKNESYKLFEQFLIDSARKPPSKEKDKPNSYRTAMDLINLVGSLNASSEKSILRLKKFINERQLLPEDKSKLEEILTALEKERKSYTKREGRATKITPTAIEAKADGLAIGKESKFNVNKRGKETSLRLKYGVGDIRTFSGKKRNVLTKFEKLDLRNNGWFNSNILDDIPLYWLEKAGYTKGLDAWDSEPEQEKTNTIKRIAGILPEYPMLNQDGANMKSSLETIYNDIWDDYSSGKPTDPEDFAYFTQGIRDGLQNKSGGKTEDFLKLKEFKQDILPKLITAIKKGIQIDEDNKISYRLGPRFSKIMYRLGDSDERKQIIEDLLIIVKGQSLSNKYAGRNAAEIKAIEDSIIQMVSEEIYGKTILSYIISTFLEIYKNTTILRELFKVPNPEVEVEFLETSTFEPEKPKKDNKKPKFDELNKPRKKVEFGSKSIEAGKKTREMVDRETKRLKEISDDKENDITYTEEEIHRMVGWRKTTKKVAQRNMNNGIIRDSKGKPKMENKVVYEKYQPSLYKNLKETKKSLDNLLIGMREPDDIIIKEDVGLILESLNKKQRKRVKAILNIADPTEYFGHDFLKLEDLVKVLKSLGVVKGDKKLNKKVLKLENENLKVVKLATRLRKDYENLYRDLREMIYPKSGE